MRTGVPGRGLACVRGGLTVALALLVFASATLYYSRHELLKISGANAVERPPLYLPQARYVRLVSLGYDSFFSRILWFNTINYFGRQFDGSQDYRWLGHMCELVTTLDTRATHAFEFCATLLSWVAKEPKKSNELLDSAIEHNPDYWRFRYLRGFNYWYFLDRLDLAKDDFLKASTMEGAPPILTSLASRLVAQDNGPGLARQFLEEMVANTSDPTAKKALKRKLKRAQLSERMMILQNALDHFVREKGHEPGNLDELVSAGYLTKIPPEPYKGNFFVESGEIKTSSKKKGLVFAGKTAQTGMMKDEFKELDK